MDAAALANFERIKTNYSSQGKRCILLARKIVRSNEIVFAPETTDFENAMLESAKAGLTLVGLVAIVDPLRPEIPQVVSTLRNAGIRIAMVSAHIISLDTGHILTGVGHW